jgi:hypothetical protein
MSTSRLRAVAIAISNWFACPNRSIIDAGESSTSDGGEVYTSVQSGKPKFKSLWTSLRRTKVWDLFGSTAVGQTTACIRT